LLATTDPAKRADAMRAAARALALDPESKDAAQIVTGLMIAPPRGRLPDELHGELRTLEGKQAVREAREAAYALCTYFLFIPLVLWVGVKDALVVTSVFVAVALQVALNFWLAHRKTPRVVVPMLAHIVLALLLSRLFSPLLVVPAIVVSFGIITAQHSGPMDRPRIVMGLALVALLLPFALEWLGVLAATWSVDDAGIAITSAALEFDGAPAAVYIVTSYVAILVATMLYGRGLAAKRRNAQRHLAVQAWQLRQLFPVQTPARFDSSPALART
jgi:serine/threonine-protein kinase